MSDTSQNTILVTGASGFLGSEIVRQCNSNNQQVRSIGRRQQDHPDYHSLDLVSDQIPTELFANVHTVIHSAGLAHQFGKSANDRQRFFAVNADATEKTIRASAANGVRHFVLVSSSGVYGPSEHLRDENSECNPQGHYADSKFAAEEKAIAAAKETGIHLTILRMTTLYGEGDHGNMNRLIKAIDSGKFVQIGDGYNRKNFIHKSDAAHACLIIASSQPSKITTYNVGTSSVAMNQVLDGIIGALECKPPIRVPSFIASSISGIAAAVCLGKGPFAGLNRSIKKWLSNDEFSTEKFQSEFGFSGEVTLEEGLARQVSAYRSSQAEGQSSLKKASGSEIGKPAKVSIFKRFFDVLLCLFLIAIFAVPMLIIAALVKLTSKGPAFYWSERVGKNNKLFPMAKFRSMRTDAPEVATHLLGDSKSWITPLGRIMRKTSLDELPQLWNILAGHMSFVGPRPALHNQEDLNELRTALGVNEIRPGITGLAQISGRDELLISEKVEFDRQYMKRQSFLFDLNMIVKTALAVILKKDVKQADDDSIVPYVVLREGTGECVIATPKTISAVALATDPRPETRFVSLRTEHPLTVETLNDAVGNCSATYAFVREGEFENPESVNDTITKLPSGSISLSYLPASESNDLSQQIVQDTQVVRRAIETTNADPKSNSQDPDCQQRLENPTSGINS